MSSSINWRLPISPGWQGDLRTCGASAQSMVPCEQSLMWLLVCKEHLRPWKSFKPLPGLQLWKARETNTNPRVKYQLLEMINMNIQTAVARTLEHTTCGGKKNPSEEVSHGQAYLIEITKQGPLSHKSVNHAISQCPLLPTLGPLPNPMASSFTSLIATPSFNCDSIVPPASHHPAGPRHQLLP